MKKMLKKKQELLLTFSVFIVLAVLALISTSLFLRIDATEAQSYSISKATKNIINDISEQVSITYFVSSKLQDLNPYPSLIKDLLFEYASVSKGKISVVVKNTDSTDTKVASENAKEAERFGIVGQSIQVDDRGEIRLLSVYTGILITYLDRHEILPVAFNPESLEYDVTRLIKKVVNNDTSIAGILIGDSDKNFQRDYTQANNALVQAGYEVRELQKASPIDKTIDCLFVFGNNSLEDSDTYYIDQYIQGGGSVFFAVKGMDIQTQESALAKPIIQDSIFALLSKYGISIKKELVLDKASTSIPVMISDTEAVLQAYPHWISIQEKNVSKTSALTSHFSGLDLYWPSPMTIEAVNGISSEKILETSTQAWLMKEKVTIDPLESKDFLAEFNKTKGQYTLGYTLEGVFPSAFVGKSSIQLSSGESIKIEPIQGDKKAKVIVISSSDFMTDIKEILYYQVFGQNDKNPNFLFLSAAADFLSSNNDIVTIKTKQSRDLRLNKIESKEANQDMVVVTYFINFALIPGIIIAYGIIRFRRRRYLQLKKVIEAEN